jgi:hypothetical protein
MNTHEDDQRHWGHSARRLLAAQPVDPEEFYQEVVVPSGLFEQAYELFPGYNSWQSIDASAWIISQIEDTLFEPNDPQWAAMRDEVYDMVVAGLT